MDAKLIAQIDEAAAVVRRGGLVIFPTETVFGLGADAFNADACRRIFTVKGRPPDNPLIVHCAAWEDIARVAADIDPISFGLMRQYMPGPFTIIVPKTAPVPAVVTAGHPTIAVRMPAHPIAQRLLLQSGTPIAAPSANLSQRLSPTSIEMVREVGVQVDAIIENRDEENCTIGIESTIVRVVEARTVIILREGAVTKEMICAALRTMGDHADGVEVVRSQDSPLIPDTEITPGRTAIHYRPAAPLELVTGETIGARIAHWSVQQKRIGILQYLPACGAQREKQHEKGTSQSDEDKEASYSNAIWRSVPSNRHYARLLYRLLWEFDTHRCDIILAMIPHREGIGEAVYDRLTKAASRIFA